MNLISKLLRKGYTTVTSENVQDMIADGAILVDVRTTGEWNAGHPLGAIHIPLDQVGRRSTELSKDSQIITVCHSGARSAVAARALARRGFRVASLAGGISGWQRSGGAITKSPSTKDKS